MCYNIDKFIKLTQKRGKILNDKKYIIDIPELMKEWDWEKNKDLDPNKLVVGSEKKSMVDLPEV